MLSALKPVLSQYPADCCPAKVERLGTAGGFSGAELWRLDTPLGQLVLRRWPPEHPTRTRLQFIHDVLRHAHARGIGILPQPLATRAAQLFVEHDGCLWELSPWLPGQADFQHNPSRPKLRAAMRCLAEVHNATADFSRDTTRHGPSPAAATRLKKLHAILQADIPSLNALTLEQEPLDLASLTRQFLSLATTGARIAWDALSPLVNQRFLLQPCLRDIHREHVLFDGDAVSGFIDFGAMDVESVASDVARLLGSLAGDDSSSWCQGISDYEAVRPLSPGERQLIAAFDASGVVLGGWNWFQWLFVERRRFDDLGRVAARLEELATRLSCLIRQGSPASGILS